MTKVTVGDLVRILPDTWATHNERAIAGEIAEVIEVYSDNSGIAVNTSLDKNVPLNFDEFILFEAREQKESTRADEIEKAAADLGALLVSKNHDYGDSFSIQYAKYGHMSALIRMDDKMRRLETLLKGDTAKVDESISDTLLDLAGYALLAFVETKSRRNDDEK